MAPAGVAGRASARVAARVGGEARRALLAIALGVGLGVLARLFESNTAESNTAESKEARAWREPSGT